MFYNKKLQQKEKMNQIGGPYYLPKFVWFANLEEIRALDIARKYLGQKLQTGMSK